MLLQSILDEEQFGDATKLSHRELTRLAGKIVTRWKVIAGLANLNKDQVDNVDLSLRLTGPRDKAAEILSMINRKADFSRKELVCHLEEAGLNYLADEVLNGSYRHIDPDSPGALPITTPES